MKNKKVLIDGDIVAYRASFHAQDYDLETAQNKADELLEYILNQSLDFPSVNSNFVVYITGKGNFRYSIAKSYEYKGNRKDGVKPIFLAAVRQHLVDKWGAVVSEGEEADDLIAIEATKNDYDVVVASIDKDMLQIPCVHFNFNKNEWKVVSEFEGTKFFYTQILTGDKADNIVGLYRVGPVKAGKILSGCSNEKELYEAVVKAYEGDTERVTENARLLWLRREEGQLWQPPE